MQVIGLLKSFHGYKHLVQNMFKTSSALSLFENSNMLEVPYS